jgi:colanic acid/amylovoran biosynthesis glycosyltransferase
MLREVCFLRQLGFDIQVASIRTPDRNLDLMTTAELEEARSTYYVKSSALSQLALAHAHTLVSRPIHYIRGLGGALRNDALYGLFYFIEAVAVGYWMRRHGLSHVHTHYASTVGFLVKRIFPVTLSIAFHGSAEFLDPFGFRLAEKVWEWIPIDSSRGRSVPIPRPSKSFASGNWRP